VDVVVHTTTDSNGHRRIGEIVALPGRVEGTGDSSVIEIEDLFVSRGHRLVRADGFPPRPERFETQYLGQAVGGRPRCWRDEGAASCPRVGMRSESSEC
jgi:hypothetical protein